MTNNTIVWLVWSTEDSVVVAVFSEEAKARQYCRYRNVNQDNGDEYVTKTIGEQSFQYRPEYFTEHFSVDLTEPEPTPTDLTPYFVTLLKSGELLHCDRASFEDYEHNKQKVWFDNSESIASVAVYVLGRDKQSAINLADTRRKWLLDQKHWPTDQERENGTADVRENIDWPEKLEEHDAE